MGSTVHSSVMAFFSDRPAIRAVSPLGAADLSVIELQYEDAVLALGDDAASHSSVCSPAVHWTT